MKEDKFEEELKATLELCDKIDYIINNTIVCSFCLSENSSDKTNCWKCDVTLNKEEGDEY